MRIGQAPDSLAALPAVKLQAVSHPTPLSRKYLVGLTGGIGSGKSSVARRFAALGATIVDTDAIARTLTAVGGAAIEPIRRAFGDPAIDATGALDRDQMRTLVFSDAAAKKKLEGILHPLIRTQSEREIATAASPYIIFDVPLLIESGTYRERCDRVLVVDVPEETQIARVIARDGRSQQAVTAIIAAQVPRATRLAAANDVIHNVGPENELDAQVAVLHRDYLARSVHRAVGKTGPSQ